MIANGSRWAAVGAILALAAVVRVSAMFYGTLSGDDATVALIAKHVLSGENFPVFFYRQTYMGSLNGIHLVPALYLFGPSVLLVRLNAIAWSLLFPLGLYLLGRRIFDEPIGRADAGARRGPAVPPHVLEHGGGASLRDECLRGLAAPSGPRGTDRTVGARPDPGVGRLRPPRGTGLVDEPQSGCGPGPVS